MSAASRWNPNSAADEVMDEVRERLDEARNLNRLEIKRLKKLGSGYFWDPVKKQVVKKSGSSYQFVRHDRRSGSRKSAEPRRFLSVMGGLLWDLKEKKLYRKMGEHFILYAPDRRKLGGKSPTGSERRG